jgi:predicted transcriptional regulator
MTIKEQSNNGLSQAGRSGADGSRTSADGIGAFNTRARIAAPAPSSSAGGSHRKSTVAKVSHTLSVALAERLEEFAFFQRVSESAVIEHALTKFFGQGADDAALGETLRKDGAGRRRKS